MNCLAGKSPSPSKRASKPNSRDDLLGRTGVHAGGTPLQRGACGRTGAALPFPPGVPSAAVRQGVPGRAGFFPEDVCVPDGALDSCQVVVAILDGPDADSGTSFEMGYARGRGKRVIGVRTDFRGGEDHGVNLMLSNACSDLVTEPSTTATPGRLAERIVSVLAAGESLAPQRTSEGSLLP